MSPRPRRPGGLAVDSSGEPAYDPSINVAELVAAVEKRLDDLRASSQEHILAELAGLRRELANQVSFQATTRDHDRLVNETADARHQAAARELRASIEATAETLRRAVGETAKTLAEEHRNTWDRLAARVTELERNQYQEQGKQRLADPQLTEALATLKGLQLSTTERGGKGAGLHAGWIYLTGAVAFLLMLYTFGSKLLGGD